MCRRTPHRGAQRWEQKPAGEQLPKQEGLELNFHGEPPFAGKLFNSSMNCQRNNHGTAHWKKSRCKIPRRRCDNSNRAGFAAANVGACGKEFQVFLGIDSGQAGLLAEGLIGFTVLRQTMIEVSFPAELP